MSMAKNVALPGTGDPLLDYAMMMVHDAIFSYVKLRLADGSRHFECAASEASAILLTAASMAGGPQA
jgi:hypothetical protein